MTVAIDTRKSTPTSPRAAGRDELTELLKEEEGTMPRLLHVSPDGSGRYIAVDRDGQVWRGEMRRSKTSEEEYITWKPLVSEFPRNT